MTHWLVIGKVVPCGCDCTSSAALLCWGMHRPTLQEQSVVYRTVPYRTLPYLTVPYVPYRTLPYLKAVVVTAAVYVGPRPLPDSCVLQETKHGDGSKQWQKLAVQRLTGRELTQCVDVLLQARLLWSEQNDKKV
jgi:hypothetical protein